VKHKIKKGLKALVDQFVVDVRKRLNVYEVSKVMNSDQSGIELER
jgi:hypothetical protein